VARIYYSFQLHVSISGLEFDVFLNPCAVNINTMTAMWSAHFAQ
jgi:hypothetical protein